MTETLQTKYTTDIMDMKLKDILKNCINSFVDILENMTILWSSNIEEISNDDFSSNIYNFCVKIINILTKNNRGIYLGLLLIFFSFVLFNFQIFWNTS